jgi:hypothetical protein
MVGDTSFRGSCDMTISTERLEEYRTLRDETLKRVELHHQIIGATLILAGTMLSIGSNTERATILFVYPLLATFLASGLISNGLMLIQIGAYIRSIEQKNEGFHDGWATFLDARYSGIWRLEKWSILGLFLVTDALAIGVGLLATNLQLDPINLVLLVAAVIATIVTAAVVQYPHTYHRELRKRDTVR